MQCWRRRDRNLSLGGSDNDDARQDDDGTVGGAATQRRPLFEGHARTHRISHYEYAINDRRRRKEIAEIVRWIWTERRTCVM